MAKEDVLKSVEEVIRAAKIDIKKNGSTSDKVRQLTGLVNSYTRLLSYSEMVGSSEDGKGEPGYYENMVAENIPN